MRLAEALVLRADVRKRIEQLRDRIRLSALVQDGEEPPENPQELLDEVSTCSISSRSWFSGLTTPISRYHSRTGGRSRMRWRSETL
jgi:hypothetical protein